MNFTALTHLAPPGDTHCANRIVCGAEHRASCFHDFNSEPGRYDSLTSELTCTSNHRHSVRRQARARAKMLKINLMKMSLSPMLLNFWINIHHALLWKWRWLSYEIPNLCWIEYIHLSCTSAWPVMASILVISVQELGSNVSLLTLIPSQMSRPTSIIYDPKGVETVALKISTAHCAKGKMGTSRIYW